MDDKISATVRFTPEARAATDSFNKSYEVHLQMVKRSLRPIVYNVLQQHYIAAESFATQANQPKTLIMQFQRGLQRILTWSESEKKRFIQSIGVEQGVSRAVRLPADILHAISSLLHVLMYTDNEITDLVEQGLTHCPGFEVRAPTTVGDVVLQCVQEAAFHFEGVPTLFSRAIKAELWIENRQKIFNQIDHIIGFVIIEMATNMVRSVCKRLMESRYNTKQRENKDFKESEPVKEPVKQAVKEPASTRYTDTKLLSGHIDDQQYIEHVYNRGPYRHTSTPMRLSATLVEPKQYSAGTTMAESSSQTSIPHSRRNVQTPALQQPLQPIQKPLEPLQKPLQKTLEPLQKPLEPVPAAPVAPSAVKQIVQYIRPIAPPTNMPFQLVAAEEGKKQEEEEEKQEEEKQKKGERQEEEEREEEEKDEILDELRRQQTERDDEEEKQLQKQEESKKHDIASDKVKSSSPLPAQTSNEFITLVPQAHVISEGARNGAAAIIPQKKTQPTAAAPKPEQKDLSKISAILLDDDSTKHGRDAPENVVQLLQDRESTQSSQ